MVTKLTRIGSEGDQKNSSRGVPPSCLVQTPRDLAVALVKCLGDTGEAQWLEPSCGDGAFLLALRDAGVPRQRITGIDLGEDATPADMVARVERGRDFLSWSLENRGRFDCVVGNPPFVRMSALDQELKRTALMRATQSTIAVPGTSNYWLPFLVASIDCLRRRGSLGFILPAAWDYATYAAPLRQAIGGLVSQVEIHRSNRPLFPGRQDGSIALICRGFHAGRCIPSRFEYEDGDALCRALEGGTSVTPLAGQPARRRKRSREGIRTVLAQSVLSLHIGAVTGEARFFLLTEQQRRERDLPHSSLSRVVTRASQIRSAEIDRRSWEKLRDLGERVWLFRPAEQDITLTAVKRYLEQGGCDRSRYKVSARKVWYRTPLPTAVHGFVSGMSKNSPWICLNRMRGLAATNTLYVVTFRRPHTIAEKAAWCLSLLHPIARDAARSASRVYGDGLRKLEPSDIADLPLVVPKTTLDALEVYREALAHLFSGNLEASERIAEHWFRSQAREDRRGSTQGQ